MLEMLKSCVYTPLALRHIDRLIDRFCKESKLNMSLMEDKIKKSKTKIYVGNSFARGLPFFKEIFLT